MREPARELLAAGMAIVLSACRSVPAPGPSHEPTAPENGAVVAPMESPAPTPTRAAKIEDSALRLAHVFWPRLAVDTQGVLRCRDAADCGEVAGLRPLAVGRSAVIVDKAGPKLVYPKNQFIPLPGALSGVVNAVSEFGSTLQDGAGQVWSTFGCAAEQETVLPHFRWRGPMPAEPFRVLAGGERLACGLLPSTNEVKCWTPWSTPCRPEKVPLDRAVGSLVIGREHACVLDAAGGVACWGDCSFGQCGFIAERKNDYQFELAHSTERFAQRAPRKQSLTFATPVKQIYAVENMTCAWLESNELWCWGDTGQLVFRDTRNAENFSQRMLVGHDARNFPVFKATFESTMPSSPLLMPDDCKATDITILGHQICAVCESGCAQCWGFNLNDSLGYGDSKDRWMPQNGCLEFD